MNEVMKCAYIYKVLKSCRTLDHLMSFSDWLEKIKLPLDNKFIYQSAVIRQALNIDNMQKALTESTNNDSIQSESNN